jgi:hypothetical protein
VNFDGALFKDTEVSAAIIPESMAKEMNIRVRHAGGADVTLPPGTLETDRKHDRVRFVATK